MKKLKTDELVSGMITAEDIYNYSNQLILPKGLVLTDKAISKLRFHAVYKVRVEDAMAGTETPPEPVPLPEIPALNIPEQAASDEPASKTPELSSPDTASDEQRPPLDFSLGSAKPILSMPEETPEFSLPTVSFQDKLKASQEFQQFKQAFDKEVTQFKSTINEVVLKNAPLDVDVLLDDALNLIEQGHGAFGIFDMLHSMRESDDTTYVHCLNVSLFCHVFAGWLNLSEEETRLATLCGLLHDIGKLTVPEILLNKVEPLTAEELATVRAHTRNGYLLIQNMELDNHVKNVILTHHERCDGSGYPFGLSDLRIDAYAKMVAIADSYDAMTSKRAYRNAMSPIQAIEVMQNEGLQKYDVHLIMVFLENVMNSFIGNRVLLSTGEQGDIVFINKDKITRPTVKCQNHFVNLTEETEVQIVSML